MDILLQVIANGILIGGVYALGALSIAIIFKSTQIFNFAVGEMMAVGMFSAWTLMEIGVPLWLSIIIGTLVIAMVGWLIERFGLRSLIGQPAVTSVMATFAIMFILRGIILIIWNAVVSSYPMSLPGGHLRAGSVNFSNDLVWTFAMAAVTVIAVVIFFRYTRQGLAMRATAEDQPLAQVRGISVARIYSMTWLLSAAVCGIAGIFVAFRTGVSQDITGLGLAAFPAVLLGGLESIPGALVGGLVVGLTVSLTSAYLDPAVSSISPFIILLLVLVFKTEGLFGLEKIERI